MKIANNRSKILSAAILAVSVVTPALATTTGSTVGQVGEIVVVAATGGAPGNDDLRIFLSGNVAICGSGSNQTYAYVNQTDVGYPGILANVLTARAMGASVTLEWSIDSANNCHLFGLAW